MPTTRSQWLFVMITALACLSIGYWLGKPSAANASGVSPTVTSQMSSPKLPDSMAQQARSLMQSYRQQCLAQPDNHSCQVQRQAFASLLPSLDRYCQHNQVRACAIGSELRDLLAGGHQVLSKRA